MCENVHRFNELLIVNHGNSLNKILYNEKQNPFN